MPYLSRSGKDIKLNQPNLGLVLISKKIDKKGIVTLRVDIDSLGNASNIHVIEAFSASSEDKTIAIAKKEKWYPSTYRGKPIDYNNFIFSVKFN